MPATGQDTGDATYKKMVFLGRKAGDYSSVTVTEVNLGTEGQEKDPLEEGTANLRTRRLASVSKAQERGAACAEAQQGEGIWLWGIWKKFNTVQGLSTSSEKLRPQR